MSTAPPPPPPPPPQPPAGPAGSVGPLGPVGPVGGPATVPAPPPPPRTRPSTPWWALLLTVLGVLTVLGLVAAVAGSFAVAASTSSARDTIRGEQVSGVRVLGASGEVVVTVDEDLGDSIVVDVETRTRWREAVVRSETVGGELVLEIDCGEGGTWTWASCDSDFDIRMSPDADLSVDLAAGGVTGVGLGGDLTVDLATGGVSLDELANARVDVDVATGGIDLAFAEAPIDVAATTNVGGVDIELPDDGSSYAVTSEVGMAGEEIAVDTDRSSSRRIDVASNVGGVYVGYAGARGEDWGRGGWEGGGGGWGRQDDR